MSACTGNTSFFGNLFNNLKYFSMSVDCSTNTDGLLGKSIFDFFD